MGGRRGERAWAGGGSCVALLNRTWSYQDWSSRLITQTSASPSGEVQNLTYQYDTGGNLTSLHDQPGSVNQWQCFAYDNLDRLTSAYTRSNSTCTGYQATSPDPYQVTFNYNNIGNITNATGTGTGTGTGTVNGNYTYSSGNSGPTLSPQPAPTPTPTTQPGTRPPAPQHSVPRSLPTTSKTDSKASPERGQTSTHYSTPRGQE